jgi:outer membrane protein W
MSGSGYSAKALADMPVSGSIGMIGRVGIEQVNLAGSSYTTSLMYLTADLIVRYSFDMNWAMTPYIGAGFGLHYPLSKSSNILNVPQISSTTVFFLPTIGFTWPMNESMYMVGQFEYGLFPQSNSISTSLMTGRFGLAWNW